MCFGLFVCLELYAVPTVFQLLNGDSTQVKVFWTTFNQYISSPLSNRSTIAIILSTKGKATATSFFKTSFCRGRGSNLRSLTLDADVLTSRRPRWPKCVLGWVGNISGKGEKYIFSSPHVLKGFFLKVVNVGIVW